MVTVVFVSVVGARFLLPLLIPRFPLPTILGCLVLDGADQTIFQSFGYDPPEYQGYDKAMDVYYLAIAYLATLRNWVSFPAFQVGWFLYFYRLVGVAAFELSHARPLLLIFPNTFEYFFIAYEAARSRWRTIALSFRTWVAVAAAIWIFVKLPQEFWIHVAKMDVTEVLADRPWVGGLMALVLVALLVLGWLYGRPRLPAPDWSWRFRADPLPAEMDEAREMAAWRASYDAVRSPATLEKVALVGLIAVIYGQALPDFDGSSTDLFISVSIVVVVNVAITLAAARRRVSFESLTITFGVRLLMNVVLVVVADWALRRDGGGISAGDTLFFLSLISLITTMHDRYRPVHATRRHALAAEKRAALSGDAGDQPG